MRAVRFVSLLLSLVGLLTYTWAWAVAARPAIRYVVRLRDANGFRYRVAIFAPDEKLEVGKAGSGYEPAGERRAVGTYAVLIQRDGMRQRRLQRIALFGEEDRAERQGIFDLQNRGVFAVSNGRRGGPDLLLVTQSQTSNTRTGRLFFVQGGRIVPVTFREPGEKPNIACVLSGWPIKRSRPFVYRTDYYVNGDGFFHRYEWAFKPKEQAFVLLRKGRGGPD